MRKAQYQPTLKQVKKLKTFFFDYKQSSLPRGQYEPSSPITNDLHTLGC